MTPLPSPADRSLPSAAPTALPGRMLPARRAPAGSAPELTLRELVRRVPALGADRLLAELPLSATRWFGLRSLPVIDAQGLPSGILRRDDLASWTRQQQVRPDAHVERRVRELSRPPLAVWGPDEPQGAMLGRLYGGVPSVGEECLVTERDGRYAGIVTAIDLLAPSWSTRAA